ncbi:MAG: SOS response-associated peptidase, partial [Paracoccaceae bacterium]
ETPLKATAEIFNAQMAESLVTVPNFNICPSENISVLVSNSGKRKLGQMRWGFVPHWCKSVADGPLLFNARAETLAEKPAFRDACRKRRCLIPADGFYEWEKKVGSKSKPFYVRRSDRQQMIFAGIWQFSGDSEDRIPTCTIITVPASEQISGIHNRMPLLIDPSDWAGWLGERQGIKAAKLMKTPSHIELEVVNVTNEIKSTNAPV